jgi:hypothetical protein
MSQSPNHEVGQGTGNPSAQTPPVTAMRPPGRKDAPAGLSGSPLHPPHSAIFTEAVNNWRTISGWPR